MSTIEIMGNAVPDIPRIYTALAEWSACITFIFLLRKRMTQGKSALFAILWCVLQSGFMVLTGNVSLVFWIPCMFLAFGMMIVGIGELTMVGRRETIYYAMHAFVLAEFEASFFWQIFYYARTILGVWDWIAVPLMVVVYTGTEMLVYDRVKRHLPKDRRLELSRKDFYSAVIITVAVFAISNISFVSSRTPFSSDYDFYIKNIRTLVDFGGVAILYAHLVQCSETKTRRMLDAVQGVLQTQYQQYKYSRESVNLINIKYHDLKHQIAILRAEEDAGKRAEFLDKMEEEIRRYDLQNKTGNAVLDTILTSKSMYCDKHNVTMTTVADGTLLDHMEAMDIASIFGNALDNALESVLKLEDTEKRLIHVTVARQKSFTLIQVENYFEGKLNMEGGKLKSTKKDQPNHGFGIESIKYSAEKYGGAVSFGVEAGWFRLKILLP